MPAHRLYIETQVGFFGNIVQTVSRGGQIDMAHLIQVNCLGKYRLDACGNHTVDQLGSYPKT